MSPCRENFVPRCSFIYNSSAINIIMIEVVERERKTPQLDTPESSVKSGQGGGGGGRHENKRPSSPLARLPSASAKRVKSEGGWEAGSASKSTTHPQYLLLQLTQALMPFEEGKVFQSIIAITIIISVGVCISIPIGASPSYFFNFPFPGD